jgi:DNA invertase Pin-like site-specific DNA recombinase
MKYGYARVSSKDQNESRQIENLTNHGIQVENIFVDKQSGKDFDRPEYKRLLETVTEGDVIYIHSIDRLGRNYDEIIKNWQIITKDIKADIVVLDMPLLDTTVENHNLTGRFIADLVLQILSYVAETERANIRKRQQEGIDIAVKEGKFRKKSYDLERMRELKEDVDAGLISVKGACYELGISETTWRRRMKQEEWF